MSLKIKNGELFVYCPFFVTKKTIFGFIEKNKNWIEKNISGFRPSIIQKDSIEEYKKQAKDYIPKRVEEIAKKFGFSYNNVRITSANTRWGSCSSKKNLNFTYRLILTPRDVIDYVIIHELAHTVHMNHSNEFWNLVASAMPEYKEKEKYLKQNYDLYIA